MAMKVAIIGANGRTGRVITRLALDRGWGVVAAVRSPEKMKDLQHERLEVKKTDVLSVQSMTSALSGCDAVVSCLGAPAGQMWWWCTITLYSESSRAIVDAMRQCSLKKLVVMSSWCTVKKPENPKLFEWVLKPALMGRYLKDMARMEDYLSGECVDIEYTVVRAPGLSDEQASTKTFVALEGQFVPNGALFIPRANVAKYMLDCVETGQHTNQFMAVAIES